MSKPYEVLTVFRDKPIDTHAFSSLDSARIRIGLNKPEAVFIQLRESKWKILEEWRASEQLQETGR